MSINYNLLKSCMAKGQIDIVISVAAMAYWLYWMLTTVQPMGGEIVYIAVISGMVLGTAIGHMIRVCYIRIIAKNAIDEADRNVRVLREVRHTLDKTSASKVEGEACVK